MTDSDASIYHSAVIWLELKGESALDEARQMLDETLRRGDGKAAGTWQRIIAALKDIGLRPGTVPAHG